MNDVELKLSVKVAWWVRPLLMILAWFYSVTAMSPNMELVQQILLRGTRPVVNKVRHN